MSQQKPDQSIEDIIRDKRDHILEIATRNGVSNIRIFGSAARGEARPDSDIDFLVDGLENAPWGGGRLLMDLQTLLGRRVDLVSEGDLHDLIREKVLQEAVRL